MLPAFRDRKARLELMDSQNVEATILFPSMANGVEQDLLDQPEVLYANLRSFNRWIEEDWGFGGDGRIFAAGCLSLADANLAVQELDRLLKAGVKVIYLRPAPGGGARPCSIADRKFDAFWARLEEAKVPVGFHLYVVPFHEDNTLELVKRIGVDRVLMGSDYPHAEGLAQPTEFEESLTAVDPGSVRKIMRDNLRDNLRDLLVSANR